MSNGKPIEKAYMKVKKDGGPAFPLPMSQLVASPGSEVDYGSPGMTLRDYFAGQALTRMNLDDQWTAKDPARRAYEYADAMLAEREKE